MDKGNRADKGVSLLEFSDPAFVIPVIVTALSDLAFLFVMGMAIPVFGQVLLAYIIFFHYFASFFVLLFIFFKLKHFAPKLILGIFIFLPLPLLTIGMVIAIFAQNRLVELVITQAAIKALDVFVPPAGVAIEAANVATKAVETAAVAGETAEGAAVAAETLEAAAETAEVAAKTAEVSDGVGLARGARKALTTHEEKLRRELGEEENGEGEITQEEIFGGPEATDKSKELFEPDFNAQNKDEEENEFELQKKFEARKRAETEERRTSQKEGENPVPIPLPPGSVDENGRESALNEVNLGKEA